MRSLVLAIALLGAAPVVAAAGPRGVPGVTVASSSDSSPGVLDAHARSQHGEIVRRALLDVLRRSGADVRHAGIGPRKLDAVVTAWRISTAAHQTDVAVELRVVIADDHGRMRSILTGRARVSAPAAPGRATPLAELREQAIAEAVRSLRPALEDQLARAVG
jgi:hypothetical protein